MTKDHILSEIRRTADQNRGAPLGSERFFAETGIKKSDWYGKYWIRWGDALKEAGLQPNQFNKAIAEEDLLSSLAILMRELGHFPLYGERRLKARSDPGFPSHSTFARLGNKKACAARLRAFLLDQGEKDLAALCVLDDHVAEETGLVPRSSTDAEHGFVYLMKSGSSTKSAGRNHSAAGSMTLLSSFQTN